MKKLDLTGVLLILGGILAFALVVWGFYEDAKHAHDHNDQQVAECKALGGFARTSEDGWLIECTFPYGGRR